jgi:hypothetical protein
MLLRAAPKEKVKLICLTLKNKVKITRALEFKPRGHFYYFLDFLSYASSFG